jgi:5'-nucleotidase
MRILVCNDDGHFSPGLAALENAAATLGAEVWTVAPAVKRSSAGHSLSLHDDFTLTQLSERRFACSGTPADCAVAGLGWLLRDRPPALVLSGINEGRNVGEDIAYSGTMAIAREASFWGVPAIAFSGEKGIAFGDVAVAQWLAATLQTLVAHIGAWHLPQHWLSINLPAALPAAMAPATAGRAKIAAHVEAEPQAPGVTRLRYAAGRRVEPMAGDELAQLAAGRACIYRLRWNAVDSLPASLLDALNTPARPPG